MSNWCTRGLTYVIKGGNTASQILILGDEIENQPSEASLHWVQAVVCSLQLRTSAPVPGSNHSPLVCAHSQCHPASVPGNVESTGIFLVAL